MTENEIAKMRGELIMKRRLIEALGKVMITEIGEKRFKQLMTKAVQDAVFGEEEAGHERT